MDVAFVVRELPWRFLGVKNRFIHHWGQWHGGGLGDAAAIAVIMMTVMSPLVTTWIARRRTRAAHNSPSAWFGCRNSALELEPGTFVRSDLLHDRNPFTPEDIQIGH
jgi:hypothetical protein